MSPKGISTPQDLINYFNSIQGTGLVSGEFIETGDPASVTTDPLAALQSATGQYVGMIGIDYWHAGGTGAPDTATANADAIANWQAGGLVEFNAAMPNPTTGGSALDTSNLDVAGLLTPGTATNNALNTSLSQVAAGFKQLQDAGVVVLYRPYWEMNGNWNWWGAGELSGTQFQALWQYTYNYMTNTMGLHNLVWEYAINAGYTLPGRTLTDTYPGSAYVDITGQDIYSNNPGIDGQSTYQALVALDKPTALAEFGSGGASGGDTNFSMPTLISQIQTYMPKTVFWLQWWAQNAGGNGWGIEQDQNASAALNDGYVINRGQIVNNAGSSPTPSAASANDTVVTGTSTSIIDANSNKWTITSNGQVAINGVTDTVTANVIELAYVNGTIWHENASHLWWGETQPNDSWSPSGGTATSPLPAVSANDTVVTGTQSAITDASYNHWTITSNGQVAINGVTDTVTANVIELAYVNGTIWHENASHLWWGETQPNDSWSPSSGTATSPLPAPVAITPSANDTVVTGTTAAITDASGNKWTITSNGQVAINGTTDTTTSNVTELAYVNGTIWQENASKLWWGETAPNASWSPSAGTATSPLPVPVVPTPSANDTVVTGTTSAITDASGNKWTITSSGQVAINGKADTTTANVTELAYVNGTIWQENTSKLWWGETTPNASWSPSAGTATSPLPAAPTASPNDTMVLAGSTNAITDASGNKWTITSAGQVAVNGVADTTTGNVTELAYVNKTIWQENTGKMWWGETSPTAGWAPGAGTATSPLPAPVTVAAGTASATVSQSQVSVVVSAGTHMLFVKGSGDIVSLSGGASTITDSGSGNTYILPAAGKGTSTFTGNILTAGDTLDLKPALAATNWNGAASTLAKYVTVTDTVKAAIVSIAPTSGGAGVAIATINGATTANLTSLLAHAII